MPGAALPAIDTPADWTDNTDNWRAVDAEYLQARSVLRFSTEPVRNAALGPSTATPLPEAGQVNYVASLDSLTYSGTGGKWRKVTSLVNLTVSDTLASVGLRLATDGTDSLVIESGKVSLGPGQVLQVTGSQVLIKTGAATAALTTTASNLVSSLPLTIPGGALGAVSTTGITNSGTLTTASLSSVGDLSGGTLHITTSSALGLTATVGTLNASTTVAVTGPLSATGNAHLANLLVSGSTLSNYGHASANLSLADSGVSTLTGDAIILNPTSLIPVRYRTAAGPTFALVVVSDTDPGVANFPEGTFWVDPL